jgi:hypothetical protein
MPQEFFGQEKAGSEYVKSTPREWTPNELEWVIAKVESGHSVADVADAIGRTAISVQIKLKRVSKKSDTYNDKNRESKYAANRMFVESVQPKTVLDVYAGNSFYKGIDGIDVTDNDTDDKFDTQYSMDALKLLCQMYLDGRKFDVVDLDPYGSAYDCFDLALKMARKGIVVSFGEWGHRRWKRVDFVRPRYGIQTVDGFTPDAFIAEFQRIAISNHKTATVFDALQYGNFLRVHFTLEKYKTTEQWNV